MSRRLKTRAARRVAREQRTRAQGCGKGCGDGGSLVANEGSRPCRTATEDGGPMQRGLKGQRKRRSGPLEGVYVDVDVDGISVSERER